VKPTVDLLCELIALRTDHPDGDELALCRHLAPILAARGADEVRVVETGRGAGGPGGYVWARWGHPTLLFNAHVDTVPANTGWSRDPWQPHVDGERVWGLGAADTKGAIAAILEAVTRIRPKDVAVLFSGDEEKGTRAVRAFLASPERAGVTHAIVCEPTSRQAGVRHRGVLAVEAGVRGAGGHSSRADAMPAPIVTMAKLAVALDELGRGADLCMNVAAIDGGVAFNVVPDAASLLYSIRPPPGFDRAGWDARVGARADAIDAAITQTPRIDHAPFACSDEATVRRLIGDAVTGYVGLDFWTEAALHEAAGIAAVVIGPGDIGHAHAPDESVAIDDLRWAAETFTQVISRHHG
jgi:acetylornithine deacetylase